jgi:hypothetical protein
MTASAQIGTLRGVPDSASISLDSGTSVKGTSKNTSKGTHPKSNFRSVLEQADNTQGAIQQKQKDSDSSTAAAVSQPVTPAAEAPRLILPFTTSIPLRQDATSAPDDTATQDAADSTDDAATAAAADGNAAPAAMATSSPTPTILRGALGLYSLPLRSEAKINRATGWSQPGSQPKTPAKSQVKLQSKLADSVPPQSTTASLDRALPPAQTAPANPAIPIRVTSGNTLEQSAAVLQNSSTANEAPYIASTSTSDRTIAYQYRVSNDRPAETAVSSRARQEGQKVSDPTQAVTVLTPVTNTVAPQPPISNAPRQDTKALERGSAVPQESPAASGTDLKNAMPPLVERADETPAAPNTGAIAFAARLTPAAESQPPASESTRPGEPLAIPVAAKQIAPAADLPADSHSGESGAQSNKEKASDLFAKPETLVPQMHVAVADQRAIPANNHASTIPLSPAAHLDHVIDPPAAAPKTNNDITVRIPDSTNQGMAVRFVERAGEIHVSVRTGDAEMAQSLRGGLNDLVNHLEDGGIRTEVWQPGSGSNAAYSQNDSHQPFADPDGSNGRQYSSGSNSEQESSQQNKPRWVEELEGSIGNPNFKEMTQLWQA